MPLSDRFKRSCAICCHARIGLRQSHTSDHKNRFIASGGHQCRRKCCLEHLADEKLNTLQPKGVLFCPGYSGSDIIDNKQILNYLDAQKLIGIYTTESGIMIPEKSLCGIVLNNYRFSCKNCFIQSKCDYIKKGTTCYNQ